MKSLKDVWCASWLFRSRFGDVIRTTDSDFSMVQKNRGEFGKIDIFPNTNGFGVSFVARIGIIELPGSFEIIKQRAPAKVIILGLIRRVVVNEKTDEHLCCSFGRKHVEFRSAVERVFSSSFLDGNGFISFGRSNFRVQHDDRYNKKSVHPQSIKNRGQKRQRKLRKRHRLGIF